MRLAIVVLAMLCASARAVSGARDAETMDRLVEAHLTRARELVKSGVPRGDL
jgi:hypothetical protein